MSEEISILVCDKCFRASCWQGIFMCDEAQHAGTVLKSTEELKRMDLESPEYWKLPQISI